MFVIQEGQVEVLMNAMAAKRGLRIVG